MKEKVEATVKLIENSKSIIAFSGAGASVTAGTLWLLHCEFDRSLLGIGTYRGTEGIDTKEDLKQRVKKKKKVEVEPDDESSDVDYVALQPTRTHTCM